MHRLIPFAVLLVLLAPCWCSADNKAQIALLQQQVQQLKAQEKALVQSLKGRSQAIATRGRWSAAGLAQQRALLKIEEERLLALTADKTARAQIKQEYKLVNAVLGGGGRLDKAARQTFAAQREAFIVMVEATYRSQIQQLQNQITFLSQAAQKAKKAKTPKKA